MLAGCAAALALLAAACTPAEDTRPLRYSPTPVDDPSLARETAPGATGDAGAPEFRPVFRTEEPRKPETRKARSGPPPRRDDPPPREPASVPSTTEERQLSNTERRLEAERQRIERDLDRFDAGRLSRSYNDPTDPGFRDAGNPAVRQRLEMERNAIEGQLRSLRRQQGLSDRLLDR